MGSTPDFTHLLKRDLIDYLKGRGLPTAEANKRALELMEFVEREAHATACPLCREGTCDPVALLLGICGMARLLDVLDGLIDPEDDDTSTTT